MAGYRQFRAEGPDLVLDRLEGPTLARAAAGGATGPDEAGHILLDIAVELRGGDPALAAVEIGRLGTAEQLVRTTADRPGSG